MDHKIFINENFMECRINVVRPPPMGIWSVVKVRAEGSFRRENEAALFFSRRLIRLRRKNKVRTFSKKDRFYYFVLACLKLD